MESISIIDSRGGRSAPPVNPLCSALAEVVLRRSPAHTSENASKSDVSGAWAHATCCVTGSGLNTNALSRITTAQMKNHPPSFLVS
jgi:hypothetical protein